MRRLDDEDQDSQQQDYPQYRRAPRFIKNSLENIDFERITLNTSYCQYPVLSLVCRQLDWEQETRSSSESWDVWWTDGAIEAEQLFRLQEHQKINHFPGMFGLARKNLLGKSLMRMRKEFKEHYNFFPHTWSLPGQYSDLALFDQALETKSCTYIAKPEASSQGKGIFLTKDIVNLKGGNYVVQTYLEKPYLINKLKFDLRIYVLLAGCDPLRIYIYNEGLARFATTTYVKPKKKNMKEACMHLTNYAINKLSPNFVFNKNSKEGDVGHKRTLTSVYKLMESEGVDINRLKEKIEECFVKTFIVGQPLLSHLYRMCQPINYANDMCFQILGMDILIGANHQPYLLQVNHTPSFTTDTPLDKHVKLNLIKDTLRLMNINIATKTEKVNKKLKSNQLRYNGKLGNTKLDQEAKEHTRILQQKRRDQYENAHLGNFKKIYPIEDREKMKQYGKFLTFAQRTFEETSGMKNKGGRGKAAGMETTPGAPRSASMAKSCAPALLKSQRDDPGSPMFQKIKHENPATVQLRKKSRAFRVEDSMKLPQIPATPKQQICTMKISAQAATDNRSNINHSQYVGPKVSQSIVDVVGSRIEYLPMSTGRKSNRTSQVRESSLDVGRFVSPKTISLRQFQDQLMVLQKAPANFEKYMSRREQARELMVSAKVESLRVIPAKKNICELVFDRE